jgi:hypothetical protein
MTGPRPRRLGPRITPPWPQHGMALTVDQGSMRRPAFLCNHSICGRPKRSFSAATHAHRAPCRWGGRRMRFQNRSYLSTRKRPGAAAFPTAIVRRAVATGLARPAGKRVGVFKHHGPVVGRALSCTPTQYLRTLLSHPIFCSGAHHNYSLLVMANDAGRSRRTAHASAKPPRLRCSFHQTPS